MADRTMDDAGTPFSRTGPEGEDRGDGAALLRALSRARGFALYFVECNDSAYCQTRADTLRERLDRRIADIELGDVERGSTRPTIDYVLERRLAGVSDEAVVFVWGLHHLLPSTAGDEAIARHTLNEVNWRRGAWARLDRPPVVWLPEDALRRLARNAPDFFDWNSGVYVAHPAADDEE